MSTIDYRLRALEIAATAHPGLRPHELMATAAAYYDWAREGAAQPKAPAQTKIEQVRDASEGSTRLRTQSAPAGLSTPVAEGKAADSPGPLTQREGQCLFGLIDMLRAGKNPKRAELREYVEGKNSLGYLLRRLEHLGYIRRTGATSNIVVEVLRDTDGSPIDPPLSSERDVKHDWLPSEKSVLAWLEQHGDPEKTVHQDEIAYAIGLSGTTVQKALATLEANGAIKKHGHTLAQRYEVIQGIAEAKPKQYQRTTTEYGEAFSCQRDEMVFDAIVNAHREGEHPAIERMARDLRMSKTSITNSVRTLVSEGWLERDEVSDPKRKLYTVLAMPDGSEPPARPSCVVPDGIKTTDLEMQVLAAVVEAQRGGRNPTLMDLARAVGRKHKDIPGHALRRLQNKGYITRSYYGKAVRVDVLKTHDGSEPPKRPPESTPVTEHRPLCSGGVPGDTPSTPSAARAKGPGHHRHGKAAQVAHLPNSRLKPIGEGEAKVLRAMIQKSSDPKTLNDILGMPIQTIAAMQANLIKKGYVGKKSGETFEVLYTPAGKRIGNQSESIEDYLARGGKITRGEAKYVAPTGQSYGRSDHVGDGITGAG